MVGFQYTNSWFEHTCKSNWEILLPALKPQRVLEIGSYEGASTCYLIKSEYPSEIYCVDSWEGGIEHDSAVMSGVEKSFDSNTAISLAALEQPPKIVKCKGLSRQVLPTLLHQGNGSSFDFIYVDGSHQAPDVLSDAIFAFELCRVGGVIGFDDYSWSEFVTKDRDPLRCPKLAIDAFTNVFSRKVEILTGLPLSQLYVAKLSD